MSDKYKDLEGSVPVDGDITPITRRPIDQLDSSQWQQMTDAELIDQRQALYNRMNMALTMGQSQFVPAMKQGLAIIDNMLKERGVGESTHLI